MTNEGSKKNQGDLIAEEIVKVTDAIAEMAVILARAPVHRQFEILQAIALAFGFRFDAVGPKSSRLEAR